MYIYICENIYAGALEEQKSQNPNPNSNALKYSAEENWWDLSIFTVSGAEKTLQQVSVSTTWRRTDSS